MPTSNPHPEPLPPLLATQKIHVKPNRPCHSRRQLPEERISRINVCTFAVPCLEQTTLLGLFSRSVTSQQCPEVTVSLVHEIQTAFLYPTFKIAISNLIGRMKYAIIRSQDFYRRLFHGHASPAQLRGIRSEVPTIKIAHSCVVLHQQGSSG